MKRRLMIIAMLLAAVLLLGSCADNGEKKLTARDIEGTWTLSDASYSQDDGISELAGFLVSAKPNGDNSVVIFKDGKITTEWEAQDGKKTSELGAYQVSDGRLFINGFVVDEVKVEGRTLTLTQLIPEKLDELPADQPVMVEVTKKTVVILERK